MKLLRDRINRNTSRRQPSLNLLQSTVSGDFLQNGFQENPYLNTQIEKALSPVRQQFATAGRSGSNASFNSQGRIAADIGYRDFLRQAQDYQRERDRQLNATNALESLSLQDINDTNRLVDLDNLVLDTYLRRVRGMPQLQAPQQFFGGSKFGGILGGAGTGFTIGSEIDRYMNNKGAETNN